MARPRTHPELLAPPLLITESERDFSNIRDALTNEIRPRGIVEKIYVADVAYLVWDILRLRRCKTAIINSAFRSALESLLSELLRKPEEWGFQLEDAAETIAQKWFSDDTVRAQVLEMLQQLKLDASAIESEAMRLSASDVEMFDRLLASAESRRNRALRSIVDYRIDFARQLDRSARSIIDGGALELQDSSSRHLSGTE